ncbi:triadin-like [Sturnira hondurensis]|uniref:triadin-like n=1 Tax=Sturnira hondurensis TaxID=192404 RepID=UPI00187AEFFA|nr:triadin-like [Sturnira hondurensis]
MRKYSVSASQVKHFQEKLEKSAVTMSQKEPQVRKETKSEKDTVKPEKTVFHGKPEEKSVKQVKATPIEKTVKTKPAKKVEHQEKESPPIKAEKSKPTLKTTEVRESEKSARISEEAEDVSSTKKQKSKPHQFLPMCLLEWLQWLWISVSVHPCTAPWRELWSTKFSRTEATRTIDTHA